jgi:hypothetical protein
VVLSKDVQVTLNVEHALSRLAAHGAQASDGYTAPVGLQAAASGVGAAPSPPSAAVASTPPSAVVVPEEEAPLAPALVPADAPLAVAPLVAPEPLLVPLLPVVGAGLLGGE